MVKDITRYKNGDRDEAAKAAKKVQNAINNPINNPKTCLEMHRKGGKYYEKYLRYNRTGLQGARQRVRIFHCSVIAKYRRFLGSGNCEIHHDWIPGTPRYNYLALVEKGEHYNKNFSNPVVFFDSGNTVELRSHISEMDGKWYEKTVSHHPDGRASLIAACATVELSHKQHGWAHTHTVRELGEALLGVKNI
jgi:hypothetical protein